MRRAKRDKKNLLSARQRDHRHARMKATKARNLRPSLEPIHVNMTGEELKMIWGYTHFRSIVFIPDRMYKVGMVDGAPTNAASHTAGSRSDQHTLTIT